MATTDPTQPLEADRSLADLVTRLGDDLSTLMRQELELAKVETKAEVSKAGKAGAMFGAAAVLGLDALLLLLLAAAWGLDALLPTGLAFLIVGVVVAAVAGGLALIGRRKVQQVSPVPETTVETLKEDAQWLKDQKS